MQQLFALIQMGNKLTKTPFIAEHIRIASSVIRNTQFHTLVQISKLTEPVGKDIIVKVGCIKDCSVRLKGDTSTRKFCRTLCLGVVQACAPLTELIFRLGTAFQFLNKTTAGESH